MQLDSAYMAANAEGRLRMMALRTPLLLGRHAVENDTDIQRPPPDQGPRRANGAVHGLGGGLRASRVVLRRKRRRAAGSAEVSATRESSSAANGAVAARPA